MGLYWVNEGCVSVIFGMLLCSTAAEQHAKYHTDFTSKMKIVNYMNISGYHDNLTHWGRMTYICVGKLTNIGSDNGLSPGRRQAIIWTNAGILLIRPLGTNFSEILNQNSYIFIHENSFENVVWKMATIFSRPQCVKRLVLYIYRYNMKQTWT